MLPEEGLDVLPLFAGVVFGFVEVDDGAFPFLVFEGLADGAEVREGEVALAAVLGLGELVLGEVLGVDGLLTPFAGVRPFAVAFGIDGDPVGRDGDVLLGAELELTLPVERPAGSWGVLGADFATRGCPEERGEELLGADGVSVAFCGNGLAPFLAGAFAWTLPGAEAGEGVLLVAATEPVTALWIVSTFSMVAIASASSAFTAAKGDAFCAVFISVGWIAKRWPDVHTGSS